VSLLADGSSLSVVSSADVWQRQWPELFVAFRQSVVRRSAALRKWFAASVVDHATATGTVAGMSGAVLDAVVASLCAGVTGATSSGDEYSAFLVHVQLLDFVQEHVRYLVAWADDREAYDTVALGKLLVPLYDALRDNGGGGGGGGGGDACANRWHFRSQVVVTLTTIVIQLDVLHSEPPRVLHLVHTLMALAFGAPTLRASTDDAPPAQRSPSRLLREMSCRCLAMLERTSGGLLAGSLTALVEQVRSEPTHAAQAFAELLSDVVYGVVVVAAHESAAAAARGAKAAPFDGNPIGHFLGAPTQFQLTTLAVPTPLQVLRAAEPSGDALLAVSATCSLARVSLSPAGLKAMTQCLVPLLEAVSMMERYGVVHVMLRLMAIVRLLGETAVLNADLFRRQFARFLLTDTPCVTHAALLMRKWFPSAFGGVGGDRALASRIVETTRLPLLAAEQRFASLQWMSGLSVLQSTTPRGGAADPAALQPHSDLLLAHACDDAREVEERLLLLAWCAPLASAADAAALIERLQCIADFRSVPATSRRVKVWFDAVRGLLQRAAGQPAAFDVVLGAVVNVAREDDAHRFAPRLIQLLNETDGAVADRLALAFAELLESLPATALHGFVGLAERVVSRQCVDAGRVLRALRRMLQQQQQQQSQALVLQSDWALGTGVLAVVRRMMLKRSSSAVAVDAAVEPRVVEHADLLSDVLERLAHQYGDVDVRDRALLYHSLLANLGATRIRALLEPLSSARGLSAQAESEAGLSAMFHPLEADEHARVPTFLLCERDADAPIALADSGALEVRLRVSFATSGAPPPRLVVLAGQLLLRAEPRFCDSIAPIDLPPLLYDATATSRGTEVTLLLDPLVPMPCALVGDCVFNDADGVVCTTVVQVRVQVAFRDLVWPAMLNGARAQFDDEWRRVDDSMAVDGAASGERSARLLQRVDSDRWRALCASKALARFAVDDDMLALRVLPNWRVLIRVVSIGADTRLDIRTDFWRLLEHLESWIGEVVR
jgi:hypothetical protein